MYKENFTSDRLERITIADVRKWIEYQRVTKDGLKFKGRWLVHDAFEILDLI